MICHDTFYAGRFETTGYDIFTIDTGHEKEFMMGYDLYAAVIDILRGVIFGRFESLLWHGMAGMTAKKGKTILLCMATPNTYFGVAES